MNRRCLNDIEVVIYDDDIPKEYADHVSKENIVAWDIETSGLDWRNNRIGTCQLYTPNGPVVIVKIGNIRPERLRSLLLDTSVRKVFHHAMFDLRFMAYHWKIQSLGASCTKIASKLLDKDGGNKHSLQLLLKRYLNVEIDKTEQLSNWLSDKLTEEQMHYAALDVIFLIPLLDVLEKELESKNLLEFAHKCFAHIPTRVQLEILGYEDIYSY